MFDWRNIDVEAEALGGRAAQLLHVGERGVAVFLRLARAEQVQIGAVEDVDGLWHGPASSAENLVRFIGGRAAKGKPGRFSGLRLALADRQGLGRGPVDHVLERR